ncbi:hypothetical protein HYFRA_00011205 [Hymenoscyphus fraxineus]|uniref:Uncharacterized protein n=1 Tax=Hymenoscyphus fraxineus TaxID=746836 RepID=A0A9N9KZB3_9HELO|nr:hypothetical protein HYFRA_00011205 [Hymenoscyphus fraxineus]
MKYSVIAALALAAPAIMASPTKEMVQKRSTLYTDTINVDEKLTGKPGSDLFNDGRVPNFVATELGKRQENNTFEPDPNRPIVTPALIFVLQCTDAGFRGNCIVFGARPGRCGKSHSLQESCSNADVLKVDYNDFDPFNSTFISGVYNNNVSSISTNTGGKCQFHHADYETLSARGAVKISFLEIGATTKEMIGDSPPATTTILLNHWRRIPELWNTNAELLHGDVKANRCDTQIPRMQ